MAAHGAVQVAAEHDACERTWWSKPSLLTKRTLAPTGTTLT